MCLLAVLLHLAAIGTGFAFGVDADGDDLDDAIELVVGADPLNPDADGDGLTDGFEFASGGWGDAMEITEYSPPHALTCLLGAVDWYETWVARSNSQLRRS